MLPPLMRNDYQTCRNADVFKRLRTGNHSIAAAIDVARRAKEECPPKLVAYLVILCFERRCPKQNTVARLKSIDFPPKKFWTGHATVRGITLSAGILARNVEKQIYTAKNDIFAEISSICI